MGQDEEIREYERALRRSGRDVVVVEREEWERLFPTITFTLRAGAVTFPTITFTLRAGAVMMVLNESGRDQGIEIRPHCFVPQTVGPPPGLFDDTVGREAESSEGGGES